MPAKPGSRNARPPLIWKRSISLDLASDQVSVDGRGGVGFALFAQKGGAFSEEIAVPLDKLRDGARETLEIGDRNDVVALSFGHAGDGNIHSTFLFSPDDADEERRADAACHELFDLALRLEGTVTGEHGIGWLKRGQLERQLGPAGFDLHLRIKQALDPKGLLNPGKKR